MREELIGWLITTSPDGTPQPVPVWFLWDRPDSFLVYSKPGTAKLRNIAERPRVALHLDGDGKGGDIVVVLGDAALADDPPAHEVPAYVEKYAELIAGHTLDARELRRRVLRGGAHRGHAAARIVNPAPDVCPHW